MRKHNILTYIATIVILAAFAAAVECLVLWYITEVWTV